MGSGNETQERCQGEMREERESKGGGGILTEIPGSVGGKKSIEKPELWVHSLKRRLDIIVTQGDNRGQPVGSPKIVKSRDSWIKTWYSPDNRVVPKEALKVQEKGERPREPVEQTDRKVVPRQEYFLSRQRLGKERKRDAKSKSQTDSWPGEEKNVHNLRGLHPRVTQYGKSV
eukprot:833446-Amorphochlora_amoeboformis.AAC.1